MAPGGLTFTMKKKPNELLSAIMREISSTAETPAEGFMQLDEWAAEWGVGRTAAKKYLTVAIGRGLMERRMYRTDLGIYVRPQPFYGPTSCRIHKPKSG